jgi:DNA-binding CsgD family transcriptional regulator/energy-coupling factor transporter ATP-binding protein EcfA2
MATRPRVPSRSAPVLLEREAELERATAAIVRAGSGAGEVMVLEGPAGSGKTALLRAVRGLALDAGMETLSARGDDLERDFTYGVVRQLFEPPLSRTPPEVRSTLLDGAAGLAAGVLGPTSVAASPAEGSFAASHGLYWLTSNLSERAPLLLAIDDAHWADAPSLRFLHYLARRLSELPVLLLVAHRPPEPGSDAELVARLAGDPGADVVLLTPLTPAAAAELVRSLLSPDADDEFCRACHAATRGNPFLLRELVAALKHDGVEGHGADTLRVSRIAPERISRQLLLRLMRLAPMATALARAVAVLGRGAELHLAAALVDIEEAAATRAADLLIGANILAGVHPLEFVHPVVREVIYAEMPPAERALAHARAARLLFEAGAAADQTAAHVLASEPAGRTWVVEVLREAAGEAIRRGEPGAAVPHLERALAELPTAVPPPELLRELGRAQVLVGDPAGIERLQAALTGAPPGRPYAEAASELAHAGVPFGRFEEAIGILEDAIAQLGPEDRDLSLQLEAEMAIVGRLHPATAQRTASRLERVGGTIVGETPAERLILASLGTQRLLEGRPAREASALAERAWTGGLLAEQTSASPMLYDAVYVPISAEDFDLAERICAETLADAHARGSLLGIAITSSFRSNLAYRRGLIPDAESDARAGLEAALIGGYAVVPMALAFLIDALLEQGELVSATQALERHASTGEIPANFMANFLLLSRGRLRVATGQTESGIADLRELARREEHSRARSPSALPYRSHLALALARLGATAEARSLAEEELRLARKCETSCAIGMTLRVLGLLDGGQTGMERLRESVAVLEHSSAPLEEARALTDLGAALRRRGERTLAREPLRRALDLATRCGAWALAERARTELLAAGARPRRLVLSGIDALTPSERRVAQLAADGLSNRRIAQSLFVSMRTVAVHLTHAYQKLGINRREELPQALAPGAVEPRADGLG